MLREKFENLKINGAIIIDHKRFCKGAWNNVFDYECFRPSYPTSDITYVQSNINAHVVQNNTKTNRNHRICHDVLFLGHIHF